MGSCNMTCSQFHDLGYHLLDEAVEMEMNLPSNYI